MVNHHREWQFHNPVSLAFGVGVLEKLSLPVHEGGILIVTTPGSTRRGLTKRVTTFLDGREHLVLDSVTPNPALDELDGSYRLLARENIKAVIGVGGGSVLDTAKVLSFMLGITGSHFSLREYFEQGGELPCSNPLPLVTVPTTAGTGSEVTPFATVWDMQNGKKYSLASHKLFSRTALLDPILTLTLPEEITIVTGLDALSHALESIWNRNANPVSKVYALKAVDLILKNIPALTADLDNIEHRAAMMEASLLAGLAISSTRTALAHSMSYPLTARFNMPHGLACSFTLPAILAFNAEVDDGSLAEAAHCLGFPSVNALRDNLVSLYQQLGVGKLVQKYVDSVNELLTLAPQMFTPGRADNNLRRADEGQIEKILERAFLL